jgi:competence protein ComEA
MDFEELRCRGRSLLRRAGLSGVPRGVLVVVAAVCLVLVVVAIGRFWPGTASDEFALSAASTSAAVADASTAVSASTGESSDAQASAAQASTAASSSSAAAIVVDVEGAVVSPGVKELAADARAVDAIEAAGGFTKRAQRKQVNLAQKLSDGMQLYVPAKGEAQASGSGTSSGAGSSSGSSTGEATELVNLNTASSEELQTLSGIGPSLAQRIIDYREQNGGFASVEDLKEVSGIGDVRYASLKDKVCV